MAKLWLLRGSHEAPGWNTLRQDLKDEKVDIQHLDPKVWALVLAEDEPTGYVGLEAVEPADGMYLDPNGSPSYLVGGEFAASAEEVIEALGDDARELLDRFGNAETVLERLGRVF
jgi:hypothetical protein